MKKLIIQVVIYVLIVATIKIYAQDPCFPECDSLLYTSTITETTYLGSCTFTIEYEVQVCKIGCILRTHGIITSGDCDSSAAFLRSVLYAAQDSLILTNPDFSDCRPHQDGAIKIIKFVEPACWARLIFEPNIYTHCDPLSCCIFTYWVSDDNENLGKYIHRLYMVETPDPCTNPPPYCIVTCE